MGGWAVKKNFSPIAGLHAWCKMDAVNWEDDATVQTMPSRHLCPNCWTGPIVPSGRTPRTVDPSSCGGREHDLQARVTPPKPSSMSGCVLQHLLFFFQKKKSQNPAISQNSRGPIWDVHQFYVMKIVLRFVSRGVPGPCRIYQRVYLFWIHTLRRFFVNGCLALDEISWSWLSTCRTVLSNPVRHCSVDTELMRGVNDSE